MLAIEGLERGKIVSGCALAKREVLKLQPNLGHDRVWWRGRLRRGGRSGRLGGRVGGGRRLLGLAGGRGGGIGGLFRFDRRGGGDAGGIGGVASVLACRGGSG